MIGVRMCWWLATHWRRFVALLGPRIVLLCSALLSEELIRGPSSADLES